ncbi:type IV pilus modification protein PilV [Pistricoccus aurantiacus]|uniref:Type IV pilus modification protein PilV n=1 Tax=Pistricoccus aurantiacus TaxID=1883414 RepID=A0A5B8SS72_9GAMM|nr:type IV pilus modification protein PilV [Pistricoccus aurantiacus]QEA38837.1 type IV pilus modification protein PilV [Pistricoccus aurantiacus]
MMRRQCLQGLPRPFCNISSFIVGPTRQTGAGLIEVLVALLLLSTSLLGMGMLQVKTLQYQRASYSETMAQLLAMDMAERIQSNLEALAAYDGKATDTIAANLCTDNCSPEKRLVERDLLAWKVSIEQIANAGLTEGKGKISVDTSTSPQRVTLSLHWKETLKDIKDKDDKNTSKAEFAFEVQP